VQRQYFTAATAQITGDRQASRTGNDIKHIEHHGALFLLGKLRREKITIRLSAAATNQGYVGRGRNIVQTAGRYGTCSESIAYGLGIVVPAIGLNLTAERCMASPTAA
jgi:hypothetical protein